MKKYTELPPSATLFIYNYTLSLPPSVSLNMYSFTKFTFLCYFVHV